MTDQDNLPPKGTFAYLQKATSGRKHSKAAAARKSNARTSERPHARSNERTTEATVYVIDVPPERQQQRSTFNVFRDQYEALKKLQQATADAGQKRPEMGHMVQEAIDLYLARQAKHLPNVRLRKTSSAKT